MSLLSQAGEWALRNGHGAIVARATTLVYGLRDGRRRRFSVDRDGRWVNEQREVTFVSPTIHTHYLADVERDTIDGFEFGFAPATGDIVVDIGAGIGTEVVVYSRQVGPTGRVVAVEANPTTFDALQKTVSRSRLENVTPVQAAIADRDGVLFMEDDVRQHIGNSVVGVSQGIEVRALTLDALVDQLGLDRVDHLKMNIEGAEALAIKGMDRTIRQIRSAAIACHDFAAELRSNPDMRTLAAVRTFLEEHGFAVAQRVGDPRPWVRDTLYGVRQ